MIAFHGDKKIKALFVFILQAIALEILDADLETGEVFYKKRPFRTITTRGYLVASVRLCGVKKQIKAHQVVWAVAGKTISNGETLDHINRNKTDNRLTNLRTCSNKENSQNRRSYVGTGNPAAKINQRIADKIRRNHSLGNSYSSIACEFNISKSLVASIIRGEMWL